MKNFKAGFVVGAAAQLGALAVQLIVNRLAARASS